VCKAQKGKNAMVEVAQIRDGSIFGEMSIIDENPRSATVIALTDTEVFHLPKAKFKKYLEQTPNLRIRFLENAVKVLVGRCRELNDNYVTSQYNLWRNAVQKKEAA
jgi:signal-transduction protein with cAMP-binding, CBS, and nucleotidyltransferase domain